MRSLFRHRTLLAVLALTAFGACGDDPVTAPTPTDLVSIELPPVNLDDGGVEPYFAGVSTDKGDYVPGEHVTVTGAGFWPGERVSLEFIEEPLEHPPQTIEVIADEFGEFTNSEFPIHDH